MEKIRISKYFTDCGVMSRRAAEEEIRLGRVSVNGRIAELGEKIDPEADEVVYRGRVIKPQIDEKICVMLNKPRGIVCTANDEKGRRNVTELCRDVKGADGQKARLYPIGRLDMDSEGLLILTNDGEVANKLMHPKHHVEKIYHVKVKGEIEPEVLTTLNGPMVIDDYKIKPVQVSIIERKEGNTILRFTLSEGRNRQIRKMCEQVNLKITRLKRVAVGDLTIGMLKPGQWKYMNYNEISILKGMS